MDFKKIKYERGLIVENVGNEINNRMYDLDILQKDLAKITYDDLGTSEKYAYYMISSLRNYIIHSIPQAPSRIPHAFNKIIIILNGLNVEEDAPIIDFLKKYDENLEYPPKTNYKFVEPLETTLPKLSSKDKNWIEYVASKLANK